jgi:hypothetical protein
VLSIGPEAVVQEHRDCCVGGIMIDFRKLHQAIDAAGTDIPKVEEIFNRVRSAIANAPAEKRSQLQAQFLEFCNQRAQQSKAVFEAHLAETTTKF